MRNWSIAVAIAAAATVSTAIAQVRPEDRGPPAAAPSTQSQCAPDTPRPRSNETTGSRSLSDRLAESKGVICPPTGIDPGLAIPPVGGGRMPVIPPPGTPGGDPGIQPK
jgi:hypothetical protein